MTNRQDKTNWSWVAPFLLSLALVAGGWEWFFGTQSGAITRLQERVTVIEGANLRVDDRVRIMDERLSRMEPMLEHLVRKFP